MVALGDSCRGGLRETAALSFHGQFSAPPVFPEVLVVLRKDLADGKCGPGEAAGMRQVCAWCKKDIRAVANSRHGDDVVSHGICPSCSSNFIFQLGTSLEQHIESLDLPVFVVDDDVQVEAANEAARRVFGKDLFEMKGHRGGDVFECAHARLPEGCGRTIHCSGCAIRRSVTITYQTRRPLFEIPATLTRGDPDVQSAIALTITTVKVGDSVMLRVDRIG
jgi:PAS domain-containing protein